MIESVFFNGSIGEWSRRARVGVVVFCSITIIGIGYQFFVKEKVGQYIVLLKNERQLRQALALHHRQPITVKPLTQLKVTPGALSHFSLDVLHFVGVLRESTRTVALIKEPGGRIHAVPLGEYLGCNEGRVIRIDNDRIEIEEPVHVGKRSVKKLITLHL